MRKRILIGLLPLLVCGIAIKYHYEPDAVLPDGSKAFGLVTLHGDDSSKGSSLDTPYKAERVECPNGDTLYGVNWGVDAAPDNPYRSPNDADRIVHPNGTTIRHAIWFGPTCGGTFIGGTQ